MALDVAAQNVPLLLKENIAMREFACSLKIHKPYKLFCIHYMVALCLCVLTCVTSYITLREIYVLSKQHNLNLLNFEWRKESQMFS